MAITPARLDRLSSVLDGAIPDPQAREVARRELLSLADTPPDAAAAGSPALRAEVASADRWTSRARPTFLYVMYALLLWSIPLGLLAAIRPALAHDIAAGMTAYLAGIPEPLYALFGTGYLGYTVARTWGKSRGVER